MLALVPDRTHVQQILLDAKSGFGLGELDVALLLRLLLAFSNGFRPRRGSHDALDALVRRNARR
jgi:hypothetical protein